jgi:TusA-related sulfurtransferase
MGTVAPIVLGWINALCRHDFEALPGALDPSVQFRALVPGENVIVGSAAEAVACFRRWFDDATDMDVIDEHSAMLIDRLYVRFRARVRKKGRPYLIDQSLWATLDDGKFVAVDLLCSGFRPEEVVAVNESVHVFEAGDLGCGTGLPREFRTRLTQIPIGHILEVVTGDPSAKEDLPSLARLLGHQVRSVEPGADGKHRIRVERSK